MADASTPVYRRSELGPSNTLRQGEILSSIRRYRLDPTTVADDAPAVIEAVYPYAVVLTQDCDLTQQKRWSSGDDLNLPLPCILLAELTTAKQLRSGTKDISSKVWDRIRQNRDERYHFLESAPAEHDAAGLGLEELGIDFKRYLAVPTDELYALIDAGRAQRRCVLNSPYMEHLCHRFLAYLGRIALPEPHRSVSVAPTTG